MQQNSNKILRKYVNFATYHFNNVNKLIHALFTPFLVFGILGILEHTQIHFFNFEYCTLGFVLTTLLSLYYLTIDLVSGLVTSLVYLFLCWLSHFFFLRVNPADNIKINIVIIILSYVITQLGHKIFQKRRPPSDIFMQELAAVPLLCMVETMFFFGWKKQLCSACNIEIKERIKLLPKTG